MCSPFNFPQVCPTLPDIISIKLGYLRFLKRPTDLDLKSWLNATFYLCAGCAGLLSWDVDVFSSLQLHGQQTKIKQSSRSCAWRQTLN